MKISWRTHIIPWNLACGVFLSSVGIAAWAHAGPFYSPFEQAAVQHDFVYKVYNQDQFEGNWKQLKGAIKEKWGKFTDDDLMAIEGRADRFDGIAQERYGERKEDVKEWVDQWLEDHPYDSTKRNP